MDHEMIIKWTKKLEWKIYIYGSCEWIVFFHVIPLFKAVAAAMAGTLTKERNLLFQKTFNIIKYQICWPWNDEKAKKKVKKGIPLFQFIGVSIYDTFLKEPHPLFQKPSV